MKTLSLIRFGTYAVIIGIAVMLRHQIGVIPIHLLGEDDVAALGTGTVSRKTDEIIVSPIDGVLSRLRGHWMDGPFFPIDLPRTAKPERVIQAYLSSSKMPWAIFEVRELKIGSHGEFTAARVNIGLKERVVLLQYRGEKIGWWARDYPVTDRD